LAMMVVIPRTKRMFAIFDPTTLPITISDCPAKTAAIEEANSGKEVPNATIVTPIIKGEIPNESPISSAASTNQSEDFNNSPKLPMNNNI